MTKMKAFTMPKWGIEMSEGTIAEWMVEDNQPYEKGAVITLIETDKITNEVEAEAPGRLVRIIAEAGESYPVGALLAVEADDKVAASDIDQFIAAFKPADTRFSGDDGAGAEDANQPAEIIEPTVAAVPKASTDVKISPAARARAMDAGIDIATVRGSGRNGRISLQDVDQAIQLADTPQSTDRDEEPESIEVFASPLAVRLARDHDIDLGRLTGTGPRGRIRKDDVLAELGDAQQSPESVSSSPASQTTKMTPMRKAIARRLSASKATIPHFYVRRRVRADRLLAARAAFQGKKPSVNDYLIKATALALMEVPEVNIQVHDDAVQTFGQADISVAVATDRGLLTPIVTGAEQRSLDDISSTMTALAKRARDGKLTAKEFDGGSFSLSNLGPFGVEQFDAIINPPQGAILAVGSARHEPMDDDGAIRVVPVMHLSLSCDHRAIDGATAGQFLAALTDLIEHPERL